MKKGNIIKKKFIASLLIVLTQLVFIPLPQAQAYTNPAAINLLTLDNFAVLAKTLISSPTGPTVLNDGDLGIDSPGTCTGFEAPCTGTDNGTINNGVIQYQNGVALQGQTDATSVANALMSPTPDQTITSQLGGLTLNQGVYNVGAAATNLTGTLTLDGDADSIFIFQMDSTLVTDGASSVVLTGGVQACNVFWRVGSSATFNDDTTFVGTVLAATSVSFPGGGATLEGRVIGQSAAVSFNETTVNNPTCATAEDAEALASSDSSNECVADTPEDPQWVRRTPVEGGINLTWSAMGGSKVDIQITNGEGDFEYKYENVTNDGHMFLPNVSMNQLVRIRVVNECEEGDWLVTSPSLPNTGFSPHVSIPTTL